MPILNWLNKDEAVTTSKKCTYRLLEEVPELSYGDADNENLLIQGDNLEALKALIPHYAGKVKCIFIDPPYNTRSAFEHYDDNLEHSQWLSMIYPRLELLRELLSEDGSIWITLDDSEMHYCKVISDEVFGRNNFIASMVWEKRKTRENRRVFSFNHDHILVYAKNKPKFEAVRNPLPMTDEIRKRYKNPDNDPRGDWQSISALAQAGHGTASQFYTLITPGGKEVEPPKGNCWRYSKAKMIQEIDDNRIWFGKDGNNAPRIKKFLSESEDNGVTPETLWKADEVGTTDTAKKHVNTVLDNVTFDTPKPEELLHRIIHIATNTNDLILDSFSGSGTTGAVAHKMNRRWLMVEIGDHARSHIVPRLKKVTDGEDEGGVSQALNWTGGGGFRFYKLGEAVFNEYGCLNTDIKFPTLASHIWYLETKTPLGNKADTPLLGVHNDTAYYLLYNGILGDRRPAGGNVLTSKVLNNLPDIDKHERIVIYGESSRLGEARLKQANITFKQIPYDVGTL
ncbi:TPA: site-specific DNA-methyltransferase [Vibrio cholerae]|uniref:site-specific DNA-methyltransferase n=1 Tax=Vibrio cholerae TaxID=666 RepID=UPI000841D237|nr:site-specific DNA-methyltransferase [Vibrio cholerae]